MVAARPPSETGIVLADDDRALIPANIEYQLRGHEWHKSGDCCKS